MSSVNCQISSSYYAYNMRVAAFLEDMEDFFAYSILLAANCVSISQRCLISFPL